MVKILRKHFLLLISLSLFTLVLILAGKGMPAKDFLITLLRGLSSGAITFLVASGFSLIFGLLDVLNLAHGTLFMIGAYVGWTVYVRPDTAIDLLTPILILAVGFSLTSLWRNIAAGLRLPLRILHLVSWVSLLFAVLLFLYIIPRYPVASWDVGDYANSPTTYSFMADQGTRLPPPPVAFIQISPVLAIFGLLIASCLVAFGITLLQSSSLSHVRLSWRSFALAGILSVLGIAVFLANDALTTFLSSLDPNILFILAILSTLFCGAGLGAIMEAGLIRPLYSRPIYQLMLTIGMSFIGVEMVRTLWGRPEFTMPTPPLFNGSGQGCPAHSVADWWNYHCSTFLLLGGRVRVYNELVIPIIGLLVLTAVWLLLKRSRLGMVIRAGVQDREMVEALGINVRLTFSLVFALGVGLAALGGILAAPSMGLSTGMGESLLLNALIALAIGGLTSYPGAALGSLLVGLIQQFIIKYGSIGIALPFTSLVFKPTPPLVPASTVLLMVIILLILPNGLLGKKE